MQEISSVLGVVTAIRSVGRNITFVDIEVSSGDALDTEEVKHGIALPQLLLCQWQGLQVSELNHADELGKLQLMLQTQPARGRAESEPAVLIWKQLLVGSAWLAVGSYRQTTRGSMTLHVQQLFATRCRMDPAPLTRLLDAIPHSDLHGEIVAQAIFGGVSTETVAQTGKLYAEYICNVEAGQGPKHTSQLARFLSTGQYRRGRKRTTHVPAWLQSFVQCEAAQQLTAKYPLQRYSGEGPAHSHLEPMCMENLECIDVEDDHDRLAYLHDKKKPQVAMMLDMIARTIRHWYHDIHPTTEMEASEVMKYCNYPFICLDVGCGRGDLALNIASICTEAEMHVCDVNKPSLDACRSRAEALDHDMATRMVFYNSAAQDLFNPHSSSFLHQISTKRTLMQQRHLSSSSREVPVIVVGLHACGGLSDVIMSNCAQLSWPFVCCTCCFASHPHLRDWKPRSTGSAQHVFGELAPLAENNEAEVQHSTMHLLNSIRAEVYSRKRESDCGFTESQLLDLLRNTWTTTCEPLEEGEENARGSSCSLSHNEEETPTQPSELQFIVWQFPAAWSGRNLVVQGFVEPSKLNED